MVEEHATSKPSWPTHFELESALILGQGISYTDRRTSLCVWVTHIYHNFCYEMSNGCYRIIRANRNWMFMCKTGRQEQKTTFWKTLICYWSRSSAKRFVCWEDLKPKRVDTEYCENCIVTGCADSALFSRSSFTFQDATFIFNSSRQKHAHKQKW